MNERIRELWNQSRYPSGRGHDEGKFAELIIRECSNFLKNKLDDHFAAEQLEEHFGVEE